MKEKKQKGISRRNAKETLKLKKEVGKRFNQFREFLDKRQHQVAYEFRVHQSTIANIEKGDVFPKIDYIFFLYQTYNLNPAWLITGKGEMLNLEEEKILKVSYFVDKIMRNDHILELMNLIRIPAVEQLILARLLELKFLLKEEIHKFKKEGRNQLSLSGSKSEIQRGDDKE